MEADKADERQGDDPDKGNTKVAEEFNKTGARIVVSFYVMLNIIFIVEAIY